MIIVMRPDAGEQAVQKVVEKLKKNGYQIHESRGVEKILIGAVGEKSDNVNMAIEALDGVEKVIPILAPYKLAGREFHREDTVIRVGELTIGGPQLQVMAGPCAVESREQLLEIAFMVKESGAKILRGGAYKPRTSPYAFQGMEEKGLEYLAEAREKTGLSIVTEVMDTRKVELVAQYADILQIGARNMQNFPLLKEVAKAKKPVLLKRGMAATIDEWLMAAEYIMLSGNHQVILCERGIRSFDDTYSRNVLDLSAVPILKQLTHLPVIVDPSHGTGKWPLVEPMARAAVAAGVDGLIIEVHTRPGEAICDGPQSIKPERLSNIIVEIGKIAAVMGRTL
ncbi:MAG TPA: 3-deoxy-7-phosphoheptulonate synthase [Peptococcaceae bacterium]|jgi:3-deoxy-7-phosphoheptulonate synthase|nr:3-deoxy-7-phosphoheptulonate synthase [Clostridia bacterium]HOB82228.1 3-deoxy-7-phosphoheptulonate synthase [Peptococcaceae bacterium]HPZ71516.1 3-deoxy-7-phosphoheptulonate synthase [Peptococcaceae bacterium]HQD54129.1 3-deoxy-7-phosphoheptulonate synthase [Peptococcaceae bacterium]